MWNPPVFPELSVLGGVVRQMQSGEIGIATELVMLLVAVSLYMILRPAAAPRSVLVVPHARSAPAELAERLLRSGRCGVTTASEVARKFPVLTPADVDAQLRVALRFGSEEVADAALACAVNPSGVQCAVILAFRSVPLPSALPSDARNFWTAVRDSDAHKSVKEFRNLSGSSATLAAAVTGMVRVAAQDALPAVLEALQAARKGCLLGHALRMLVDACRYGRPENMACIVELAIQHRAPLSEDLQVQCLDVFPVASVISAITKHFPPNPRPLTSAALAEAFAGLGDHEASAAAFTGAARGGPRALARMQKAWMSASRIGHYGLVRIVCDHKMGEHLGEILLSKAVDVHTFRGGVGALVTAGRRVSLSPGLVCRLETAARGFGVAAAGLRRCAQMSPFRYDEMRSLASAGDIRGAASQLMHKVQEGGVLSSAAYNKVVVGFASTAGLAKAASLIEYLKTQDFLPDCFTAAGLVKQLTSHSAKLDAELVCRILSTTKLDEVALGISGEVSLRVDCGQQILSAVGEARVRGLTPSKLRSETAGWLCRGCGRYGMVEEARSWWSTVDGEVAPVALASFVEVLASAGDIAGARETVKQASCAPAGLAYSPILKALVKDGQVHEALDVHREMLRMGVPPTAASYNMLLSCAVKGKQLSVAVGTLHQMTAAGFSGDQATIGIIVKGLCDAGHLDRAFGVFEQVQSFADDRIYNVLIDGCSCVASVSPGAVQRGITLLEQMQTRGVTPTAVTLSVAVKLLSRSGRLNEAFQVVEHLRRTTKVQPNVHVFNNLLQACVCNRDAIRMWRTVEMMASEDVEMNSRSYYWILAGASAPEALSIGRVAMGLPGGDPRLRPPACALDSAALAQGAKTCALGGLLQEWREITVSA
mmetsp:Transcript_14042/g.31106  ORF Transcript_14042/g.31106 Transcript_14042/m.31106 type:complete len:881 (+) Transcript_14042:154-2796(+)|eukprot:CAMPEP_0204361874 /NCGR_PEP_ID=MMETSP0469-20131031/39140_1 /ASSEMBLY_ACC=CAM_ASM_000384 /TAXON_ID=2969 /ORGANISM="Oxyrrhis marina" /LENGTH=880 /DNA_ID=CAMNT_0051350337 /DNA_START=112 /DNA_END=2754 /DNA_ORIENTATION=-